MAKIEARLEAVTTDTGPKSEAVSKAAPPVKPVSGAPYIADSEDVYRPGMGFDEFYTKAQKRSRVQR